MIQFMNGPASGQHLLVGRAPALIRAVQNRLTGEWDALDLLNDTVKSNETPIAYRRIGGSARIHIKFCGKAKGKSGWYAQAKYEVCKDQPDEDIMRNTSAWREWCVAQVEGAKT